MNTAQCVLKFFLLPSSMSTNTSFSWNLKWRYLLFNKEKWFPHCWTVSFKIKPTHPSSFSPRQKTAPTRSSYKLLCCLDPNTEHPALHFNHTQVHSRRSWLEWGAPSKWITCHLCCQGREHHEEVTETIGHKPWLRIPLICCLLRLQDAKHLDERCSIQSGSSLFLQIIE